MEKAHKVKKVVKTVVTKHNRIIISDVHVGMRDAKLKELYLFLKSNTCNHLILNGDIIDTYHLKSLTSTNKYAMKLLKLIMKRMNNGMKVTYIRGNHDNFIDNFIQIGLSESGNLKLANNIVIDGIDGNKYLIIHGDVFDKDVSVWLYRIGSIAYDFLLWLNRSYNYYRLKRNLPYRSISMKLKRSSKMVTNFISKFEKRIVELCLAEGYDGIIVGHTHMSGFKSFTGPNDSNIHYMNSGDWVESKTAIIETTNGEWVLYQYPTEV